MKNIFASFAAVALLASASAAQQTARIKPAPAQTQIATVPTATTEFDLVTQLPASDFAATMNLKRIYTEVLPQVLASKPEELNKINQSIEEFKTKAGFDVRQFEQAAMGVSYKAGANGAATLEPVLLVRGSFNPAALVGAAKVAVNGKFRQETVAGKNVVIITVPESSKGAAQPTRTANQDKIGQMFENVFKGEFAIVALDAKTIAVGKPLQIRSLLSPAAANARLDKEFAGYLSRKPNAVLNFATRVPAGLTETFGIGNMGNDQIGKVVNSLRQFYGTIDTNGSDASVSLAARTAADQQAQELEELLQMAKTFGGGMLAGKNDPQNQAFARIVQNTTITRNVNEVQIDAILPSDLLKFFITKKEVVTDAEVK